MRERRKLIPLVQTAVKKIAPDIIVQRTFYDEVSDRLLIGLVNGSRKHEITLYGYELDNGSDALSRKIKEGVEVLSHTPIG